MVIVVTSLKVLLMRMEGRHGCLLRMVVAAGMVVELMMAALWRYWMSLALHGRLMLVVESDCSARMEEFLLRLGLFIMACLLH